MVEVSKWATTFCHNPSDTEQAMYVFVAYSFVNNEAALNLSDLTSL